jgi:hypothetical protein
MKKIFLLAALLFAQLSFAQVNNDEKSTAKVLSAAAGWCDNNILLINATQSSGTMACDDDDPMFSFTKHDVWYTFTATSTKYAITASRTLSNSYGVELLDASGTSLLCTIGAVDADGYSSSAVVSASISTLTIGTTYYIRMGCDGLGNTNEVFKLCANPVVVPVAPVNDQCTSATAVTVGATGIAGTLKNALNSTTTTTCTTYNDVFYTFTAQAASTNIVVTPSSSLDVVVSAFTSCGSALLSCTNTALTGEVETLTLTGLTIGHDYFIQIGNAGSPPNDPDATTFTVAVQNAVTTGLMGSQSPLNNVIIYPNPASQTLTIQVPMQGVIEAELIAFNGCRLLKAEFDQQEYQFNIESVPQGVYLLRVSDGNGNQAVRKINVVK